jgi:hypothetical protein
MKIHNNKNFKTTPTESTEQRCKRFIIITEEDNKEGNEIEDNKENK